MDIPVEEIIACLSERGELEFALAVERAKNRRLIQSVAELSAQMQHEDQREAPG